MRSYCICEKWLKYALRKHLCGFREMPDTNPKYEGRRYNFSEPLKWYVKIYFR